MALENEVTAEQVSDDATPTYQATREQQKELRKKERAVSKAEAAMEEIMEQMEPLETELNDPANGSDLVKLTELTQQIEALQQKLNQLEEEWTQASMDLETFQA